MDRRNPPGLMTPSEGRKFAFPVGIAFSLLTGLLLWRGVEPVAWVTGSAAVFLFLAGTVAPGRLGPVYRGWMAMAHAISKVTTPIFMGVVYFLVLTPVSLIMRILRYDPLRKSDTGGSYWIAREPGEGARSDLRRQF